MSSIRHHLSEAGFQNPPMCHHYALATAYVNLQRAEGISSPHYALTIRKMGVV